MASLIHQHQESSLQVNTDSTTWNQEFLNGSRAVNWLKLTIMQTETLTCKRVQELSGENDGMTINGAVGKFRKHTIIAQHEGNTQTRSVMRQNKSIFQFILRALPVVP
jgi:hypothetical protein